MEDIYLVRVAGDCMVHVACANDRILCGATLAGDLERFGLPTKLVPGDCLCEQCYCALYQNARECQDADGL